MRTKNTIIFSLISTFFLIFLVSIWKILATLQGLDIKSLNLEIIFIFGFLISLAHLGINDKIKTIYKSIKALDDINFGYLTIHGQGGKKMIEKARKASEEIKSKPKIMMVTILTALKNEDLKIMGNNNNISEQVQAMASIAKELDIGVVCSGHEAKIVRNIIGSQLPIFTPGIRMTNEDKNDQQRVCTPSESIKNGANKIIMGRSLVEGNIEENIDKVSNSIG